MDGKTDDAAAIILQRISTAIEKTCDKRSMKPGLAANEATAYLKINALFATICPVSNAVLVGCTTATFMYFVAPSLPALLSFVGFALCVLLGDSIPSIVYTLLATPHRVRFNVLTGVDLKDVIDGKLDDIMQ